MAEVTWRSVAPQVYVRRHEELNLNCGLVLGSERALLVDTRSYHQHGMELLESVRELTDLEIVVVNTHAHYDHCFGNSAFRDSQIYAHAGMLDDLIATAEDQRSQIVHHLRATDREEMAQGFEATEIVPPFYLVDQDTEIDLGGRRVTLLYAGRGHTDHDLAVAVPDAGVVFAGDLVEEGADPHMEDCYPQEWAATLLALLAKPSAEGADIWVPGHGDVVDAAYVRQQAALLSTLAARLAEALAGGAAAVDTLAHAGRGLGLQDETLRDAAVRALELRR
ncbi:MBL fold metallo-hydrolase [Ornithinimicrobium panacihumi]|uniref:MBL fold metallo-hydrolase n=1 Tax=Ornithinimicrobium panacihumi TaxID=2008449 RepID=UPI003F8B06DD